jgi:molybdate transport system ATP-binding protein
VSDSRSKESKLVVGEEFLALENAAVRFGERLVFKHTRWTWRTGEQWAMLGPDGSGKSLLVEALLGRMPLAHGELRGPHAILETSDRKPTEAIAHVSPLTQRQLVVRESSFYQSRWHSGLQEGQRTVAQFLSQESVEEHNPFEVDACRGNRQLFLRRQKQFVRWLGIRPLLSRQLVHLSNGEMRKTLLVHALLKSPTLLILEDPFAGLDAATRCVLHRVIERLIRNGTLVLVATHRAEEIPRAVTHLLVIDQHRIVAQGPKRKMLYFWRERFGQVPRDLRTASLRATRPTLRKTPTTPGEPLVEFHNVNVTSGHKHILRNVTWTLREGECWALQGPNGAGKTTLLNLIQGDHPQAYVLDIRLFGRNADSTQTVWQMRQKLGWMSPELHQHYPGEWPAIDVVCSGFFNSIGLHQRGSRAQRNEAGQWLLDLGLAARAHEPFGALAFGQQRLVLLARAAVKRPRLLILDEPCQGLDAAQRHTVLAVTDRIVAETGASLIFVTHHADEIPRCLTHELRLGAGRVSKAGPVC